MTVSEQWPFVLEGIDDKAHCQLTVTSMSEHKGTDVPQYGIIPEPLTSAGLLYHLGGWLLLMTTWLMLPLSRVREIRQSQGRKFPLSFSPPPFPQHTEVHTPYMKVIQHCLVVNGHGPSLNPSFAKFLLYDFRQLSLLLYAPVFSSVIQT